MCVCVWVWAQKLKLWIFHRIFRNIVRKSNMFRLASHATDTMTWFIYGSSRNGELRNWTKSRYCVLNIAKLLSEWISNKLCSFLMVFTIFSIENGLLSLVCTVDGIDGWWRCLFDTTKLHLQFTWLIKLLILHEICQRIFAQRSMDLVSVYGNLMCNVKNYSSRTERYFFRIIFTVKMYGVW